MAHPPARSIRDFLRQSKNSLDKYDLPKLRYITWNPKGQVYAHQPNGYDPQDQSYDSSWLNMLNKLKYIRRCSSKFCILPEISENGKLHCHGWFVITDNIKWIKSVQPMLYHNGMIRITKVKEVRKDFDSYMQEDLDDTLNFIRDDKIVCLSHLTYDLLFDHIRKQQILLFGEEDDEEKKPISIDITTYFTEK